MSQDEHLVLLSKGLLFVFKTIKEMVSKRKHIRVKKHAETTYKSTFQTNEISLNVQRLI